MSSNSNGSLQIKKGGVAMENQFSTSGSGPLQPLGVGVTMDNQFPYLFKLDQRIPLGSIIEDVCAHWKLPNPGDYSLQFTGNQQYFVTEKNRSEIQNGIVMKLTLSPGKTSDIILTKLPSSNASDQHAAVKQLSELSVDPTFSEEFIGRKGLQLIISNIESGALSGEMLAYTLKSFVELMDHGLVSWDVVEPRLIKMVANCINSQKTLVDVTTLQSALEILESIVLHSSGKYNLIEQEVTVPNLIPHLQSSNVEVQKNSLKLINAIFQKATIDKMKKIAETLQSKSNRNIIVESIIHKGPISSEMIHELYVLQSLLFSLLDEKRNTPVDVNDQVHQSSIQELRQIAFDTDPTELNNKRQSHLKDFKKLGFLNNMNPAEDFVQTPPGVLALNNIMYFARTANENYTKVVLENSCRGDDHDMPFVQASIVLTKTLCEILNVRRPSAEDSSYLLADGNIYYPMFFTHDHPFEEFYCVCIQLVNKTWKEMKATHLDFAKVFSVVREQITRALTSKPQSFDQFKNCLSRLTYADITGIWQTERRNREEWASQAKPILELREQIKPEIMELIKKQRLKHLEDGTCFNMKLGRRTDKFFYCRLSPNHKVFHFGDCDEHAVPSVEQLTGKLAVVEIKEMLTGKDCPHIKDKKNKASPNPNLAFSFIPEETGMTEPVNFLAPNEETFYIWTDGYNALVGKPMTSDLTTKDLDTLLSMEIKLRLLDTEGINIPEEPPVIPKEPPNYDFVFKSL